MSFLKGGKATYRAVDVGSTAKLIVEGRSDRKSVLIQNFSTGTLLHIATSSTVTTSNTPGFRYGGWIIFNTYNNDVYGIAASTGTSARYIEIFD